MNIKEMLESLKSAPENELVYVTRGHPRLCRPLILAPTVHFEHRGYILDEGETVDALLKNNKKPIKVVVL